MIASKVFEQLAILKAYYSSRRGVGHTKTMILGAKNIDNVVVMVHTQRYASQLKRELPNAKFVLWEDFRDLQGRSAPLVIDNSAFFEILHDIFYAFRDLQEELTKKDDEISKLKDYLNS